MEALSATATRALALIAEGQRLLAEARTVQEVKQVRDLAKSARDLMQQQEFALAAMQDAAELKLRAERRLGDLLAETPKNRGGRPGKTGSTVEPVLSDIGVDKKESHRWQRVALLPEPAFEGHLREQREAGEEITTAAVLRLVQTMLRGERPPERFDPLTEAGDIYDWLYRRRESWPQQFRGDFVRLVRHQLNILETAIGGRHDRGGFGEDAPGADTGLVDAAPGEVA